MTGTWLTSLGMAALVVLLPPARLAAEDKAALGGTTISVVNVATVFSQSEKRQALNAELEKIKTRHKEKAEHLVREGAKLQKRLAAGNNNDDDKAILEKALLEVQRKVEDLQRQGQRQLANKEEAGHVSSFKEVADAASQLARRDGIHIILGYGEGSDWELFAFDNINRKMQAIDQGGTVQIFVQPGLNGTRPIIELLNGAGLKKPGLDHEAANPVKSPCAAANVALINVGFVFHKYQKATDFKIAFEKWLQPLREEGAAIKKEHEKLTNALKAEKTSAEEKERIEETVLSLKRKMENQERETVRQVKKRQEQQIVAMFKELNAVVETYALLKGIHVVLAYGEVPEGDVFAYSNLNRKMQGMDSGATVPLYLRAGADISQAIADRLNDHYLKRPRKKEVAAAAQKSEARLAIVNLGLVFGRFEKANDFRADMEKFIQPARAEGEKIKKEYLKLASDLKSDKISAEDKERIEEAMIACKRRLETLDRDVRRMVGKKQEEQIVELYKDVSSAAEQYARGHDIAIVLGYGEQPDGDLHTAHNITRKIKGMDSGATVPLHLHPSADISQTLVDLLNRAYQKKTPPKAANDPQNGRECNDGRSAKSP